MPELPQKFLLTSKVVKSDPKTIITYFIKVYYKSLIHSAEDPELLPARLLVSAKYLVEELWIIGRLDEGFDQGLI